ncbi:MAG: N-6 DNA methylase, partial [Muribaculaceae bacterium]|nr:N-6 DNA methylase [Muribaculaceae bacterium]
MEAKFEMVAKTMKGLEAVLADELRGLGADNVEPGHRMVAFEGDLEMLYKANLCCRTALRILKPFYKFTANNPDTLYEKVKEYDWSTILSPDKTFCIDTVVYSDEFTHSRFVTYRVKDGIVDWFRDRLGDDKRPGVRLKDADIMINVHIAGEAVTLSLDSSGESLHKRGYRVAQTEAPINEVLAAGIILMSGWKGDTPFVDPMCGSGTFLIEAALIAANIWPGIYRKSFAFETWPDFDPELLERLYNDDSNEREVTCKIYGSDISPKAIAIATENIKSAGVSQHIQLQTKPLSQWTEAPQPAGVFVTNPPYGERISVDDMDALYANIGSVLKNAFTGYHAWIIGYREEYFHGIGLAPSQKIALLNGALECELREYVIFTGNKKEFLASGGKLKDKDEDYRREKEARRANKRRFDDDEDDSINDYRVKHKKDGDRGDFHKKRRFDDDDRGGFSKKRRFDDDKRGGFDRKRRFDDDKRGGFDRKRRFDDD